MIRPHMRSSPVSLGQIAVRRLMTMMALYRKELDAAQCESPGCQADHSVLEVHAPCHGDGVRAFYDRRRGAVAFICRSCGRHLAEIAVADKPAAVLH
jgi:hypothetical protein